MRKQDLSSDERVIARCSWCCNNYFPRNTKMDCTVTCWLSFTGVGSRTAQAFISCAGLWDSAVSENNPVQTLNFMQKQITANSMKVGGPRRRSTSIIAVTWTLSPWWRWGGGGSVNELDAEVTEGRREGSGVTTTTAPPARRISEKGKTNLPQEWRRNWNRRLTVLPTNQSDHLRLPLNDNKFPKRDQLQLVNFSQKQTDRMKSYLCRKLWSNRTQKSFLSINDQKGQETCVWSANAPIHHLYFMLEISQFYLHSTKSLKVKTPQ